MKRVRNPLNAPSTRMSPYGKRGKKGRENRENQGKIIILRFEGPSSLVMKRGPIGRGEERNEARLVAEGGKLGIGVRPQDQL